MLARVLTASLTGLLAEAHGLRPAPFLVGLAYAALGLGLSATVVRETHGHVRAEAARHAPVDAPTGRTLFMRASLTDPALASASQAGLVNNLNDGLAWGLFPALFTAAGLSLGQVVNQQHLVVADVQRRGNVIDGLDPRDVGGAVASRACPIDHLFDPRHRLRVGPAGEGEHFDGVDGRREHRVTEQGGGRRAGVHRIEIHAQ